MITVIEEAIMAQILAAKLPYLRSLATYGGQLDGSFSEVIRQLPGVWVFFKGEGPGSALNTTRRQWKIPATFMVIVAARNVRNEAAARHGDALQIGTYQMLADLRALLLQQTFSLPIEPLKPGLTRTLFNVRLQAQAMSGFSQEWQTSYTAETRDPQYDSEFAPDAMNPDGTLPPGQTPGSSVPGGTLPPLPSLPPLGGVGLKYHLQPDDDGEPDVVDLITLQQGRIKE